MSDVGAVVVEGRYKHVSGGLYDILGVATHRESDAGSVEVVGIAKCSELPEEGELFVYRERCSSPSTEMFYQNRRLPETDESKPVKQFDLGEQVIYWQHTSAVSKKQLGARSKKWFLESVRKGECLVPRFEYVGELSES
jgi:hypothetical protein